MTENKCLWERRVGGGERCKQQCATCRKLEAEELAYPSGGIQLRLFDVLPYTV